jgi:caa(3)-type oxidase subunit IV
MEQTMKNYATLVFAALLVLTTLATLIGEWEFGRLSLGLACLPLLLGIAFAKGTLISEHFMELHSAPLLWRISVPVWFLSTVGIIWIVLA